MKAQPLTQAEELRQLTRQAHEAAKDLRAAVREFKTALGTVAQVYQAEMAGLLQDASERVQQALQVAIERVEVRLADGVPIQVLCSRCNQLSVALADPDEEMRCGGCGARFLLRGRFREQVIAGQRPPPGDGWVPGA